MTRQRYQVTQYQPGVRFDGSYTTTATKREARAEARSLRRAVRARYRKAGLYLHCWSDGDRYALLTPGDHAIEYQARVSEL